MIDAVRVTGGLLVAALYMQLRKEAERANMNDAERERKRTLDVQVLRSVIA